MTQHELIEHYRARGSKLIAKDASELLIRWATERPLEKSDSTVLSALGEPTDLPPRMKWLKVATSDPDRAGDIVKISGAELANFRRNPQFLWQHGMTIEPVHTIGKIVRLVRTNTVLYALAEYAPEGNSALADKIHSMDKAGYLPANSIGFHPLEWKPNDNGGITFLRWELIEISKVELPANPFAVDE
jgi:HK97 family phage prohead protease